MFARIKTVATAGNRLGRTLAALSDTLEEANAGLRKHLGMDRPQRGKRPAIEQKADGAEADGAAA
jgi:hypothetical protein